MQISEEKKIKRKQKFAKVFSIVALLIAFLTASILLQEMPREAHAMNNAQTPAAQIVELNHTQLAEYGIMDCVYNYETSFVMTEGSDGALNNGTWVINNVNYAEIGEDSYLQLSTDTRITINTNNDAGQNKSILQLFYYNNLRDAQQAESVGVDTREISLFVNNNTTHQLAHYIPNNAIIYEIVAYYQIDPQSALDWWSLSNYNFFYETFYIIGDGTIDSSSNLFIEYFNINYNTELGVAYATISNYQAVSDNEVDGVTAYTQIPIAFSRANRVKLEQYDTTADVAAWGLDINDFLFNNRLVDQIVYRVAATPIEFTPSFYDTNNEFILGGTPAFVPISNIIVNSSSFAINDATLSEALALGTTPYQVTKANTLWYNVTFRNRVRDLSNASSTLREIIEDIGEFIRDRAPQFAGAGIGGFLGWLAFGPFGLVIGLFAGWLGLSGFGKNLFTNLFNRFPFLPYILAIGFVVFVILAIINLINNRR